MNTNIIPLKGKLGFTQYQAIIKFLNDLGVEVADSEIDQYDDIITQEDIEAIMLSRKQIQMGLGIKNEDVFNEIEEKGKDHGNNHGLLKQRKASLKYSNIYWDIHNDSLEYSDKIIRELRLLLQELSSKLFI